MGEDAPEPLEHIWFVRTALTHTEPQHERTKEISQSLTVQSAFEAAARVRELKEALAHRFAV